MSRPHDPTAPEPSHSLLEQLVERYLTLKETDGAEAAERLLAEHPEHAGLLRARLAKLDGAGMLSPDEPTDRPTQIGPYKILDVLGEGGMGTVYVAEQKEPVRRRVALKVIKLGMDSKAVVQRFAMERQALAVMNHDCIARVFEAGTTERGQLYFVMEYVPGIRITEYCDRHKLTLEERIDLFQQVCAGVQHAHQKGVIHRDLKPGNILVTEEQGKPLPKIIDFGLARATDHMMLQQTMFTEVGQIVGTPEYMSPEQADPTATDIDTRTDIYSLGVLLYELLVGELPFSGEELRAAGFVEMQRVIREDEPPRPSTKLTTVSEATAGTAMRRRTTAHALRRALRTDLDWVALKAMAKDRNRRYESAAGLAVDLGRYLRHEPLEAGPPSAGYRLKKLARRYRGQLLAGCLVLVTAVVGALVAWDYALQAGEQARRAEKKEGEAVAQRERADEKTDEAIAEKSRADQKSRQLEGALDDFRMVSLVPLLARARDSATDLTPAWPGNEERIEDWLLRADELLASRTSLEESVASLRHPIFESDQLEPAKSELTHPTSVGARPSSDFGRASIVLYPDGSFGAVVHQRGDSKLADLMYEAAKKAVQAVEKETPSKEVPPVGSPERQSIVVSRDEFFGRLFMYETLRDLLVDLQGLEHDEVAFARLQLTWAKQIDDTSITRQQDRWDEARRAIEKADGVVASTLYAEHPVDLEPQFGLVPIGMNPVTKLWEFYHLRSAWDRESGVDPADIVVPAHDPKTGRIPVGEDTGIVFVLLPGGTFHIGAQKTDRSAPNHDPQAESDESPVHQVTLAPFFLGRHELTRAQWQRLHGGPDPSGNRQGTRYPNDAGAIGPTHPVECVDWPMSHDLLEQHGLLLPTEAQWEYGCRGGTSTPWWTGENAASLLGSANVLDQKAVSQKSHWGSQEGDFDDGWIGAAPVGSYAANGYGLFDVHGNVWEWCRDLYGGYATGTAPGGQIQADSFANRVTRGGGFDLAAREARSSVRLYFARAIRTNILGLRPARALH